MYVPDRIRSVLVGDASHLGEDDLRRLLPIPEGHDLDFKREPHGQGESKRRDIAADVCAFANDRGGWIVIGVDEAEVSDAVLCALPAETLDDEELRVRQATATFAAPVPLFDVARVTGGDGGYLVIAVPPSPRRPHAVMVNDALRYPVRHGAGKRYLAESEIADLYRSRFAEASAHIDRLTQRHAELVHELLVEERSWLTVAVQPDRGGDAPYTKKTAQELRSWLTGALHQFPSWHSAAAYNVRGGHRSYRFRDADPEPYAVFGTLHRDGAATIAHAWNYRGERDSDDVVRVADEDIVAALINTLTAAAEWAATYAGVDGDASVVAQLHPAASGSALWQYRSASRDVIGGTVPITAATHPTTVTVNIQAVRSSGVDVLLAARMLAEDLLGAFEFIEPYQIDPDGILRLRYFYRDRHDRLRQWAERRGARTSEET